MSTESSSGKPSLKRVPLPILATDKDFSIESISAIGQIQTASFIVGTEACNARCQFCVSKMTPPQGIPLKEPDINWDKFDRFMEYAKAGNAKTAMLTGKGEPTLFPHHVTKYLERIKEDEQRLGFNFEAKELQTNGITIEQKPKIFEPLLRLWKELGLTTISISIVHFDPEQNRKTYLPYKDRYIDLPNLIKMVHDAGIRVRLATVLTDGNIDGVEKLIQLIQFARDNCVEELTVRPVVKPENSRSDEASAWVGDNYLRTQAQLEMETYLNTYGTEKIVFPFGGVVYDVNGQNVCLTNCLTRNSDGYYRQLIYFPQGKISTDWTDNARELS